MRWTPRAERLFRCAGILPHVLIVERQGPFGTFVPGGVAAGVRPPGKEVPVETEVFRIVPDILKQCAPLCGGNADNLAARGAVDRRVCCTEYLVSPLLERPFVQDYQAGGEGPARIRGGAHSSEPAPYSARVVDGDAVRGFFPCESMVLWASLSPFLEQPDRHILQNEGHPIDQFFRIVVTFTQRDDIIAWF